MAVDFTLYLIADPDVADREKLPEIVARAIDGGVSIVQYRDKKSPDNIFELTAREVHTVCRKSKVPFIVNDRVAVAKRLDVDGIHVGAADMDPSAAGKLLGGNRLIGRSAHTVKEAIEAEMKGCTYVGCGSVFPTSTKKDIRGILGVNGLKEIISSVSLPVVAIGGINARNAGLLKENGLAGIAVSSAILSSQYPEKEAASLRRVLTGGG